MHARSAVQLEGASVTGNTVHDNENKAFQMKLFTLKRGFQGKYAHHSIPRIKTNLYSTI